MLVVTVTARCVVLSSVCSRSASPKVCSMTHLISIMAISHVCIRTWVQTRGAYSLRAQGEQQSTASMALRTHSATCTWLPSKHALAQCSVRTSTSTLLSIRCHPRMAPCCSS